jgi:hypothetical protein
MSIDSIRISLHNALRYKSFLLIPLEKFSEPEVVHLRL